MAKTGSEATATWLERRLKRLEQRRIKRGLALQKKAMRRVTTTALPSNGGGVVPYGVVSAFVSESEPRQATGPVSAVAMS